MTDWTSLQSSHLDAVQHDADTNTLRIRFKSGETYEYSGVPADVHDALLRAPSAGAHFHTQIRGQYPHRII